VPNARLELRARLIRIEDTRRMEDGVVDSALRSSDAAMRRAAALTAGRIGARPHSAVLRSLVTDADARVAAAAFYALGLLKDTAAVSLAVSGLRGSSDVASDAAWMLGEVGEAGRTSLLAVAADRTLDSRRRGPAILALARLRPPPVAPLLPLLGEADTAIAWRAAYVVARARSASAVRPMIGATTSPSPMVRDYAARGLARSLAGDSLGPQALDALRRLVADPDARVRVTAVRVLGAYGSAAASGIATALRDADPAVRVTAASVAHVALDSSASAWNDAWNFDTSFVVRRALADAGARRAMLRDAWRAWRADTRWQYRAAAASLDGLGPRTRRCCDSIPACTTTTDAYAPRPPKRSRDSRTVPALRDRLAADSTACCWIRTSWLAPPPWARWRKERVRRTSRPRWGRMRSRVAMRTSMRASPSGRSPTRRFARMARPFLTA
jgi:HEAT repeat protein